MRAISIIMLMSLCLVASAQNRIPLTIEKTYVINEEAVLAWEINQFSGEKCHHVIERAKIVSEGEHTVSVLTETHLLTFTHYKSIMYSDGVKVPLVAYGQRKTTLILPKK